jgi:hypothetical protein
VKPETIKAIIETRTKVGNLGKAAFNPHGRYKYVSIDTYYEKVAAAAAANGLAWVANEIKFDLLPDVGKTGIIRATYAVTLMHSSGDYLPNFSIITIVHPIQGAQTVGSAMSYLDKVFMRQLFSVATGEAGADADETNPEDLMLGEKAPKETPAPKGPGEEDLKQLEDVFVTFVPTAETENDLKQFWSDNIKGLDLLKIHAPEKHKRIIAAFSERKAQIKKENV